MTGVRSDSLDSGSADGLFGPTGPGGIATGCYLGYLGAHGGEHVASMLQTTGSADRVALAGLGRDMRLGKHDSIGAQTHVQGRGARPSS